MSDLITMMSAAAGQVGGINPREYFSTVLYTGNDTTNNITGVGFQPDLVWIKNRADVADHEIHDAVRGSAYDLRSNLTNAESDQSANFTGFTSDGFNLAGISNRYNDSPETYVAWNWKANGAGVSNTDGTITSTVSANTTAGISIVTYTGNGTRSGQTVGHGLGVAPSMIIHKPRNGVGGWFVNHSGIPNAWIVLNTTNASGTSAGNNGALNYQSTNTSTVFSFIDGAFTIDNVNESGETYVAYCFAEVEGFSKFGSYTGNGSATGPSVTTDFEPTWLMIKRTDTTGDWIILDSARDTANPRDKFLEANTSDAEATGNDVDFNATGFQLKSTSASINASGGTYIYACFA